MGWKSRILVAAVRYGVQSALDKRRRTPPAPPAPPEPILPTPPLAPPATKRRPAGSTPTVQAWVVAGVICLTGLAATFGFASLFSHPAPRPLAAVPTPPTEVEAVAESPAPTPRASPAAAVAESTPDDRPAAEGTAAPATPYRSTDYSSGYYSSSTPRSDATPTPYYYSTPRYSPTPHSSGDVWVNGYTRKDGTYVRGHSRRR